MAPKYSYLNNKRSITIVTRTIYKSSHFNFAGQQQPAASAKLGAQISCLMAKHSPDLNMKTIGGWQYAQYKVVSTLNEFYIFEIFRLFLWVHKHERHTHQPLIGLATVVANINFFSRALVFILKDYLLAFLVNDYGSVFSAKMWCGQDVVSVLDYFSFAMLLLRKLTLRSGYQWSELISPLLARRPTSGQQQRPVECS